MGERKADFAGYIIGSDREEFLASVTGDPDYIGSLSWARLPGLARVFQTHADALAVVRAWQRPDECWSVCKLWDAGAQWGVDWDWDNEGAQAADCTALLCLVCTGPSSIGR